PRQQGQDAKRSARSRAPIPRLPRKGGTFFRLGPAAADVDARVCFAVKRGEAAKRLGADFHWPPHRLALKKLRRSPHALAQIGSVCSFVSDGTHRTPEYVSEG